MNSLMPNGNYIKTTKERYMVQKYKKKPVVIEALHYNPPQDNDERELLYKKMEEFLNKDSDLFIDISSSGDVKVSIETLEGTMTVSPGDYIIKGIKGEFYPCKPDIFAASYELVND